MKLPLSYYQTEDVVGVARELLGKVLFTKINTKVSAGIIKETEAYAGITDKASHAYGGRFTSRTEIMYKPGGYSYIYLCYGTHHLFNVVTGPAGQPHAVLIRGIIPYSGQNTMAERLGKEKIMQWHTDGPGKLSKALGITTRFNGKLLNGDNIWIEDRNICVKDRDIVAGTRIGISYAEEDAKLPYRFTFKA